MNDDSILNQFESIAQSADVKAAKAQAAEQAQGALDEMREVANLCVAHLDIFLEAGVPESLAREMTIGYHDAYFSAKMRKVFK